MPLKHVLYPVHTTRCSLFRERNETQLDGGTAFKLRVKYEREVPPQPLHHLTGDLLPDESFAKHRHRENSRTVHACVKHDSKIINVI